MIKTLTRDDDFCFTYNKFICTRNLRYVIIIIIIMVDMKNKHNNTHKHDLTPRSTKGLTSSQNRS